MLSISFKRTAFPAAAFVATAAVAAAFVFVSPLLLAQAVSTSATGSHSAVSAAAGARPAAKTTAAGTTIAAQGLPLTFEQNQGQLPDGVAFLGRVSDYSVAVESSGLVFHLPGDRGSGAIRLGFAGSRGAAPTGEEKELTKTNYYIGSDPAKWRTGIANYSRVKITGLYPGIDAEFYGSAGQGSGGQGQGVQGSSGQGQIEHDFRLAPHADPAAIAMRLESPAPATLTAAGDLKIARAQGSLTFRKPVAYQLDAAGHRVSVAVDYLVASSAGHASTAGRTSEADNTQDIRFHLGPYDHTRPLVIDPVITYATYVTGGGVTTGTAMTTDPTTGDVFLTGTTNSTTTSFGVADPKTAGTSTTSFVAELAYADQGSKLTWITFFGGTNPSIPTSIASSGTYVFVGGYTKATDFPKTSGNFDAASLAGASTGFAAAFAASGTMAGTLNAATYVSTNVPALATDVTTVAALTTDSSGNVYLAGSGNGTTLTPKNGLPGMPAGFDHSTANAFVLELAADLKMELFGTYIGTDQSAPGTMTEATAIGLDSLGNIYMGGLTDGQFPYASAFTSGIFTPGYSFSAPTTAGNTYGFLVKIVPSPGGPATMHYSTSLQDDASVTVSSLVVSATGATDGQAYVAGLTGPAGTAGLSDLNQKLFWSNTATTTAVAAGLPNGLTGGLQPAAQPGQHGYILAMPPPSSLTPAVPEYFTYFGGDATVGDTIQSLAFIPTTAATPTPLLQVAGATDSTQASTSPHPLPVASGVLGTSQCVSAADLPCGFLYTLKTDLTSAYSRSFLGSTPMAGAAGTSAPSVSVDSAGHAYVLVNDQYNSTAPAFTSASALQPTPTSSASLAYVAEIAGTEVAAPPPVSLTISADGTPATPIGYGGAGAGLDSMVTFAWNIKAGTVDANNVAINVTAPPLGVAAPTQSDLTLPYPELTLEVGGTSIGGCNQALLSTANPKAGGVTCVIPKLAANQTAILTMSAFVSSHAPTTGSLSLTATAADDAGDSSGPIKQTTQFSPPSSLSVMLPLTASSASVPALAPGLVASAFPTTSITYTIMIKNAAGAGEAKTASFTVTLPTHFVVSSSTSSIAGNCDLTGGTGCTSVDIPAGGSAGTSLTYSITGTYTDTGTDLTAISNGFFVVSDLTGFLDGPSSKNLPTGTTITRAVSLSLTLIATPPGSSTAQTTFDLGAPIAFNYTIANAGPSDALGVVLTNTPLSVGSAAFTATFSSSSPCPGASYASCALPTTTAILPGSPVAVTLNANFPDVANGAVPLSAPSMNYKLTGTLSANAKLVTSGIASDTVTIQRAAHLTIALTAQAPASGVAYLASSATPTASQAVSYTFTIKNTGPDMTTGQDKLTSVLPPMPQPQFTTSTAVVGSNTCIAPYTACTVPLLATGSSVTATVTGVFPETASNAAVGMVGSVATYSATVALINSVDSDSADMTGPTVATPTLKVERSSQMVTVKSATLASGVTALRLAEPTDAAGLPATTVNYSIALSNMGLDDAKDVMVSDILPPWFTVVEAPTIAPADATLQPPSPGFQCVDTSKAMTPITAGYQTMGTAMPITCSGIALVLTSNSLVYPPPKGPLTQTISYSGKFVDSGWGVAMNDIVPQNAATAMVNVAPASAGGDFIDTGTTKTSPPLAPYTVQRAAHAQIVVKNGYFMRANLVGTGNNLPQANPVPATPDLQMAQCNPLALVAADLNPVKCSQGVIGQDPGNGVRSLVNREMTFEITVSNTGPNIATHPVLDLTAGPLVGFTLETVTFPAGTSSLTGNLTASATAIDGLQILPNQTLDYIVKGYFAPTSIGSANFAGQLTTAAYKNFYSPASQTPTYIDVPPAAGTPNFEFAQAIVTVSNTPSASTPYTIQPFDGNLKQPVTVTFSTVTTAGITGATYNPGSAPALPSGTSPNPPDAGAPPIPLYRWGNNDAMPVYFGLGTTAAVAETASNQTEICVNLGLYPVTFDKPARVLLWGLTNVPPHTTFQQVPNISTGDISNPAQTGYSSTELLPTSSLTLPMLCGSVAGFPPVNDGILTAASSGQMEIAALEPVNFAPIVSTGSLTFKANSQQQGKGVGAGSGDFQFNFGTKATTYDYNDADPCFLGSQPRTTCNDNSLTTEWGAYIFGGENFIDSSTQVLPISLPANTPGSLNTVPISTAVNLPAGMTQTYVAVADQVGHYYYHLTTPPDVGLAGSDKTTDTACDPGVSSPGYTPIPTPPACPLSASSPASGSISGTVGGSSAANPFHDGVGASEALAQATTGAADLALIQLVLPQNPDMQANQTAVGPNPTATPTISAGQSVGFGWNWLTETSAVTKDTMYTLNCVPVNPIPSSAGVTCSVQPATFTYSSTGVAPGPPAIYVSTTAPSTAGLVKPESAGHGRMLAILLPLGLLPLLLLGRNRKTLRALRVVVFIAAAGTLAVFSGCGSNGFNTGSGTATAGTPSGPYTFYATATPPTGSNLNTLYTYQFSVMVVK